MHTTSVAPRPSPFAPEYDIVIIGGGHAGAEAAWAASRMGCRTLLVSLDVSKVGQMSCNPAIGGLAKGQMVREVDALGGLMGLASDATGIQFRMLNRSKGPAVWGPRCQSDKYAYAREVQRLLATCDNLDIAPGEVSEILVDNHEDGLQKVTGVILGDCTHITCRCAIVTTGTFLRGLMHTGESKTEGGRVGEESARGLSPCLEKLGLELGRLKTGTPPRLKRQTIDFGNLKPQPGDDDPAPFSYINEYASSTPASAACVTGGSPAQRSSVWTPPMKQIHCWLTETTGAVHDIIRDNLHRAPMFSGQIKTLGPRYCPSIEDKVVRFADKPSHHIFLEPESLETDEIYCNGISTSLPRDVQEQIVRLIPGLENAEFLRYGYAVEYDMVWPHQIDSTLQARRISGLFLAGQINGTSGYEEAAGQGQVAGINAARLVKTGAADFVLRRDQAYIGVLIDDLVTKPPVEPYRMFTSRAEHRLHLRADNADERLTAIGRELGIVDDHRWNSYLSRREQLETCLQLLEQTRIKGKSCTEHLKHPDRTIADLAADAPALSNISPTIARLAEIKIKYAGYIKRQNEAIAKFVQMEEKLIPANIDYQRVTGLRNEARTKLIQHAPRSLGQAMRISGITPADVTLLAVHIAS